MVRVVEEIFDSLQIESLNQIINNFFIPVVNEEYISSDKNNGTGVCKELGRIQISDIQRDVPETIKTQINEIAKSFTDSPISLKHIMYAEYNCKYGEPNLPAHYDGDDGDLIINYQMASNTSWEMGVGLKKYDLKDNSAVVFNGNTDIHWRTHKYFKDEEYVKMIFFRFHNPVNPSDYSHNPENQDDEAFQEVIKIRGRF